MSLLSILITIVLLAANWMIFQKMGRQGWEGIIPLYNSYVLFETLYDNGWKFLMLLIPFYNIYLIFKMNIDLAHRFNKETGFGVGMTLLSFIFYPILAFGPAQYLDGSYAIQGNDVVSETLNKATTAIQEGVPQQPRKDERALDKLKELNDLYQQGIISEEEYNAKKEDLLKRI